ncbi:MAG: hypothetical protein KAJ51_01470 [Thermoplasmata archaeon]|nr:hypothetical protein [Thermoplasmata archaeon]
MRKDTIFLISSLVFLVVSIISLLFGTMNGTHYLILINIVFFWLYIIMFLLFLHYSHYYMRKQPEEGQKNYKLATIICFVFITFSILFILILPILKIETGLIINILTAVISAAIFGLVYSLVGWHDIKKEAKTSH